MTVFRVLALTGVLGLALLSSPGLADDRLKVVATFSILGDMAARIGGGRIALTTLVGPDGDAHVFRPAPSDARTLAEADLLIINGLGFEGWIERLIAASGFDGPVVVASDGIEAIALGDEAPDPHAWHSLGNTRRYARNIAAALAQADPQGRVAYGANVEAYLREMAALEVELRALVDTLAENRRTIVTSHDAFGYLAHEYGLEILAPQGLGTDTEASAADVAALIRQIREEDIGAAFVENVTDRRLLERIAAETGAVIGGTLYSDALSGPDGPAATYLDMMRHNVRSLATALGS